MAILIDENTTAIIQGITGRAGESYSRYMKAYGTKILAGVTPGRGGSTAAGVPVYDTVDEAVAKHGSIDASVT
ncbi:MAG: succinate--CoA ligase subunit alpha, partial [Candidatus Bathyarchaeota archaeon]|nr:succinate--CoA ligase subunit alpha [Candidatus Bathyarchaeota archaeon]